MSWANEVAIAEAAEKNDGLAAEILAEKIEISSTEVIVEV